MGSLRRALGGLLVAASAVLLGIVVPAYLLLPDRLAALTVFPIWVWAGSGMGLSALALGLKRSPVALVLTLLWLAVVAVGADEAQCWRSWGKERPRPGPAAAIDGKSVIRVISLNCAHFGFGTPAADLAAWQPDIVLLQEVFPSQVKQIERTLFADAGDSCYAGTNGIVTRWKIGRHLPMPQIRAHQAAVVLPNQQAIVVVNVHLTSAVTDMRLYRRDTWWWHRENRERRRAELNAVMAQLRTASPAEADRVILGGDFNANATDRVHRSVPADFVDAFAATGSGWGNTFHRLFPVLRIDYLYFRSPALVAHRCRAVTTEHSDHRFVLADVAISAPSRTPNRPSTAGVPRE